jgi:hypothetical protein
MQRYAIVRGNNIDQDQIARYLPTNYRVLGQFSEGSRQVVLIAGTDRHGWTLDDYVAPRLGSGLYAVQEIDLSHLLMSQVPADA